MSRQLALMPDTALRRQVLGAASWFWGRVLLAAAVAAATLGGAEAWRCRAAIQARDALEAEHAPITQLKLEISALGSRIASLRQSEQLAIELAVRQPLTTLLARVGRSAAYAGGELFVEQFRFDRRRAATPEPSVSTLRLRGVARDTAAITRFAQRLRDAGLFRDVQLRYTASRMLARQPMTAFDLECTL